MKGGDAVTDAQGRAFTLGEMLGRGLWGTSWAVRDSNGRELVLKVALSERDLPADATIPDGLLAACRQAALEQADLLKRQAFPWLPRLEAQLEIEGAPALVFPRYPSSLKRRIAGGVGVSETIALLLRVVKLLEETAGRPHGDLRPSNVLLNERGEPVLTDVMTPALVPWRARLADLAGDREDWHPPEADSMPARPVWDTWAICLMLWRAASAPPAIPGRDGRHEPRVALPRGGLDKVEIAALRDRVLARLKEERANSRFSPRLAERLGTLLNRGLSNEMEPSPPYRFLDAPALRPRLEEVAELIDPRVTDVGHLLLGSNAKNAVFQGGETAAFSVTIGTSAGVSGHEDVACGLQVRDLDTEGDAGRVHVPDTRYSVKAHPSGRLRFDFSLPGLPPGRYRANVAFTIKDGHADPLVAHGDFEVRPPAGYVPPPEEPAGPAPLQLPRRAQEPREEPSLLPQPLAARGADPDADLFPLPIAPSSPGFSDGPSDPGVAAVEVEVEMDPTLGPESFGSSSPMPPAPVMAPPMLVMPRMGPSAGPTIAPSSQGGSATQGGGPSTRPSDAPPPGWATSTLPSARPLASAVDYDDVAADPGSHGGFVPGPGNTEDLPSWSGAERPTGGTGLPVGAWIERGLEYVRRDTYTAFMLLLGGMLGLLIVVFALLKSC